MRIIEVDGVNQAWPEGLALLDRHGERQSSRAGDVIVAPWPVVTVYRQPTERVLLEPARDANPFFHLFEAVWMLAGRDDATWLDRFVRDFSARYGEPPHGRMHGAYGHRWRRNFDVDQLAVVVDRLRRDPTDRRVVMQMWDPVSDLFGPVEAPHVGVEGRLVDEVEWPDEPRDLPCNLCVIPRIVGGALDVTVICRSNDVVWGAYGANAVHFSVLQEYLAAALGVQVGTMYQWSNNYHAYTREVERVVKRAADGNLWQPLWLGDLGMPRETYPGTLPMVDVPSEFLRDCERWCSAESPADGVYGNSWFRRVAAPMWHVHEAYRGRGAGADAAVALTDHIEAPDWRLAAQRWLARRTR